jgi:hypothetical protein
MTLATFPPTPSRRLVGGAALVFGLALALALVPATAEASSHIPDENVDESRSLDAGEYYAVRVQADEDGRVVVGGEYLDVDADYPVSPVLMAIDRVDDDTDARMWAGFVYERAEDDQGSKVKVTTPVAQQDSQTYDSSTDGSSVSISTPVDAGTYDVVIATAPGEGPAHAELFLPGAAEITSEEVGSTFYEQSLEHAAVGYEARLFGPLSTYVRSWGHSGAEVEVGVEGALYAFMGGPLDSAATWQEPDGEPRDPTESFVRGSEEGPWTAVFPPEENQGPNCALGICANTFRGDPPYAFGANVGIAG